MKRILFLILLFSFAFGQEVIVRGRDATNKPYTLRTNNSGELITTRSATSNDTAKYIAKDESGNFKYLLTNGEGDLVTIDWAHYKLHEGDFYSFDNASTLASGDSVKHFITTGAKEIHLTYYYDATQQTTHRVIEGVTRTTAGTLLTDMNNDRNSTDTSTVVLRNSANFSGGTVLPKTQIFGISGNTTQLKQGNTRAEAEIILKKNTTYLFLLVSGGSSNVINRQYRWYEE